MVFPPIRLSFFKSDKDATPVINEAKTNGTAINFSKLIKTVPKGEIQSEVNEPHPLIAQTINKIAGDDLSQVLELLGALGYYMIAVILGLIIHAGITYSGLLKFMSKMPLKTFYKGIAPAQLLAFSTSPIVTATAVVLT